MSEDIDRVYREYVAAKSPLSFVGWMISTALLRDPEFLGKAANYAATNNER